MARTVPPKDYVDAVPFPEQVVAQTIGRVCSPYRERHGTPRQAVVVAGTKGDMAQEARVELELDKVPAAAIDGLAGFDYVWLITWLHLNDRWNATVVPPRGPKVRRGVLSTRAPHRPNPIGLTAARLVRVEGHVLFLEGIDLLDGTPVLDVKPYVPYCDAFPSARSGWLDDIEGSLLGPDRPTRKG